MPAVFEDHRVVTPEEIDELGHVNNIVYLKWTQRAAVRHSDVQGWTTADYLRLRQGWVVRSHWIEYLQPALLGEAIVIRTWVADMRRFTSSRHFEIVRATDNTVLSNSKTNWAFINFQTGKLSRIPVEVSSRFEVVESAPQGPAPTDEN